MRHLDVLVPAAAIASLLAVPAAADLGTTLVTAQLDRPVYATAPAGDDRLFVVQQEGLVKVLDAGTGTELDTFLDASSVLPGQVFGERGLLGLAFSPTYDQDGIFYVFYTAGSWALTLVRAVVSETNPNQADQSSGEVLFAIPQEFDNHNGGHIEFGPDGMLYVALGDGGGGGDPYDNAQDTSTLLGSILRLDVSGGLGSGYSIPPDNPFASGRPAPIPGEGEPARGGEQRGEIFAYGLRNPWCFSFDAVTGDLYISDVGQNRWEEVNVIPAASSGGENFGWRRMEGNHCFDPPAGCDDGSLVPPVYEYGQEGTTRCAIVGGTHYSGPITDAKDQYFFADFCSDEIWSLKLDDDGDVLAVWPRTAQLQPPSGNLLEISNVCRDGLGNLYFLNVAQGHLFRLTGSTGTTDTPEAEGTAPLVEVLGPNPFRTSIAFGVTATVEEPVEVTITDVTGRLVKRLAMDATAATRLVWDGRDESGRPVAPGVYFVGVTSPSQEHRIRVVRAN